MRLPLRGAELEQIQRLLPVGFRAIPGFKQGGKMAERDAVAASPRTLIGLTRATPGIPALLGCQLRIRGTLVIGAAEIEKEARVGLGAGQCPPLASVRRCRL